MDNTHPQEYRDFWLRCRDYTMGSGDRAWAVYNAVNYVCKYKIPGAVVECGVWKGGMSMLAALVLGARGETRPLRLYDTFDGMPRPTDADVNAAGVAALPEWEGRRRKGKKWDAYGIEGVREHLRSTGYLDNTVFDEGRVEETIQDVQYPIAVLRLDLDWYEPTAHCLKQFWPLISPGGVLLIDDYGHWNGCRKAVDEFFDALGEPILLHRDDYTGRTVVKNRVFRG